MFQLEGYLQRARMKVCELQKSIYGLKQAFRSWNIRFDLWIKSIGFIQYPDEPCVYKRCSRIVVVFFLEIHEDDISIIGNNDEKIVSSK